MTLCIDKDLEKMHDYTLKEVILQNSLTNSTLIIVFLKYYFRRWGETMYNDFKSLELFRHQVSSRVEKSLRHYAEQSKNSAEKLTSNVFSACSSLLVAFLSHEYINQNHNHQAIITFVAFVVAYILSFFIFKLVSKVFRSISYNLQHHGTGLSENEAKELVDDFDHIACDNNLVGKMFLRSYITETDKDIKEYEFYEILYYVNVSANISLRILDNSDTCVNTMDKVTAVDLHRIYDQYDMLCAARVFLLEHIKDEEIDVPENLKLIIISEIFSLEKTLKKIKEKCDKFMSDHFSDDKIKDLKAQYSRYL